MKTVTYPSPSTWERLLTAIHMHSSYLSVLLKSSFMQIRTLFTASRYIFSLTCSPVWLPYFIMLVIVIFKWIDLLKTWFLLEIFMLKLSNLWLLCFMFWLSVLLLLSEDQTCFGNVGKRSQNLVDGISSKVLLFISSNQ